MEELTGNYNPALVIFSVSIAIIASYTALELTERISSRNRIKISWLVGSSLTMGTGIWSMHFVGMLAYNIGVPITYDLTTVILSWIPAVMASGIAFYYLHKGLSNILSTIWPGILMGLGIGAMHYIGMAAMRVPVMMVYDHFMVALSVVFGAILSSISLATANYVKGRLDREEIKLGGCYLMGTAISGLHYIGMAAVNFTVAENASIPTEEGGNSTLLAYTIGLISVIIIAGAFMACLKAQKQDLKIMSQKLQQTVVLEKVNQELEKRVAARTAELKEAKEAAEERSIELQSAKEATEERNIELKKAKDAVEVASKSKDAFLANISHELRTPLNSILGYVKIMQRDSNLYDSQIQDLQIVQQSGFHLLTLINDILDLSKTTAGKMELNPAPINLQKFLEGIIGIAKMWAAEKKLPLTLETQNDLPAHINVDETRLRQILINLLSNAVKFTVSGEVILRVRAIDDPETSFNQFDRQKLRFEVVDTGVGISPEQLKKIFQPFEQVGDLKSRSAGTGLGLALSKQLVEIMGGQIRVKSKLGSGSIFWFDAIFPIVKIDAVPEPQQSSKIALNYKGKRRKVLVVDDKKENRDLLVKMLEPIGFELETATNGQEMLSLASFIQPDIILLDLFMPTKTGFTSAKELRTRPEIQNIPIIVITASSITKEMGNYLDCEAVLYKPINEQELLSNLQKYLNLEWIYHQAS